MPDQSNQSMDRNETPPARLSLNATEYAFISAVADTMIPADDLSPSGTDCGVAVFVDRQLASAWGGGAKLYRDGPFDKGKPEQGYQLPMTPRAFFAVGIAEMNTWCIETYGATFDRLSGTDRTAALTALESGKAKIPSISGKMFFDALLGIVMEGFFADPIYGGNRDKVSWAMIGFPGLPAFYGDKMDEWRGKPYVVPPKSITDLL